MGKKQQEKESLTVQSMLMTSVLILPDTTENTGFNTVLTGKSRAEQASVGHGGGGGGGQAIRKRPNSPHFPADV